MTEARSVLALGIILACAAISFPGALRAAPSGDKPNTAAATRTAPPSKAQQALDRGIAAYKKNALARAVGAFSSALSSGGLDTQGTARALYYRGLAYRKQGRAALAITDLTNALWLNNGLTEAERKDALVARSAAYKDAGIADPGAPEAQTAASAPAAPPVATTPAAPTSLSAAPAPSQPTSPATRSAAANVPQPSPPESNANPLSGIGSFFGNLFGGNQAQQQQAAAPPPGPTDVTTASTGSSNAISSWNSATEVENSHTVSASPAGKRQRVAAVQPAVATHTAAPAGKYKLQVAAVRSKAEADKIAQRFLAQHGGQIGTRTAVIDEAVFGNMGTFYRVNVGPFATAAEPDKLCKAVRGSGYDCLVVTH
ncbi:MAG: SPOR domain-containing protein [Hyphomicrobiaceae bacterium]|nr:SPOR domain-containing protein [Hyphomicrobiaceae bacterium]